jgi:hypothetical protein
MGRAVALVSGLLAVALAAGCGGGKPGPVPVKGVLKVDGQPVAGAVVVFQPRDPGGKEAYGTTDASGAFKMTTDSPGDGALPGQYKVVIQPPAEGGATPFDDPNRPARPKAAGGPKVPEKFTRPDQSPLTQDVPPNGDMAYDLKTP